MSHCGVISKRAKARTPFLMLLVMPPRKSVVAWVAATPMLPLPQDQRGPIWPATKVWSNGMFWKSRTSTEPAATMSSPGARLSR